jgi:hypothetical protein
MKNILYLILFSTLVLANNSNYDKQLKEIIKSEKLPKKISKELIITNTKLKNRVLYTTYEIEPFISKAMVAQVIAIYNDKSVTNICTNSFMRDIFENSYSQKQQYFYKDQLVENIYINKAVCENIDLRNQLSLEFVSLKNSLDADIENKKLDVSSDEYKNRVAELERKAKIIDSIACLNTPLHVKVASSSFDEIKRYKDFTDINIVNCKHQTPLYNSLFHKEKEKVAQFLIEKGADIDFDIFVGERVLHQAIKLNADSSYLEYIKVLLKNGADVDIADAQSNTPLIIAIKNNQTDVAKLLIDRSKNLNKTNDFGKSALFYAFQYENKDIAKRLLEKGASTSIVSNDGERVNDYASKDMQKLLSKYKSSTSYHINVYAFKTYPPSKKYLQKIKDLGYDYKFVKVNDLTKVYVGNFASKQEASKALHVIKKNLEKNAYITK